MYKYYSLVSLAEAFATGPTAECRRHELEVSYNSRSAFVAANAGLHTSEDHAYGIALSCKELSAMAEVLRTSGPAFVYNIANTAGAIPLRRLIYTVHYKFVVIQITREVGWIKFTQDDLAKVRAEKKLVLVG